jgi:dTDP-glucose pyrophosphorylase
MGAIMLKRLEMHHDLLIPKSATILQAMQQIDRAAMQFTLVVSPDGKVFGTLTDGDLRRALINGASIGTEIKKFANQRFVHVSEGADFNDIELLMRERNISHVPVLNSDREAVGIIVREYEVPHKDDGTPVFLMAGGLGTRLRPLTDNYPKPMIEIAERPMLEHIISEFARQGFRNFFISINYKGQIIKDYFDDGSKWNVNISYIEETKRLGTAGSLSLVEDLSVEHLIVMNADLLTQVSFKDLLSAHISSGASLTVCSRVHNYQFPFGELILSDNVVVGIQEKPIISKMMSAGIYVLKKECLSKLEYNVYCDMPELVETLIDNKLLVKSYETKEKWIDIGRPVDLETARKTFAKEID